MERNIKELCPESDKIRLKDVCMTMTSLILTFLIDSLKTSVSGIRTNNDLDDFEWYEQALSLSAKVDVYESTPRTCQRQTNRADPSTDENTLKELSLYL